MAGDDLAVVGNQHRIAETEALDRRCDLLDLSLAMTSRVSRIGLKRLDRYMLDRWTKLSHAGRQNRECRSRPPCVRRVRHFSFSYVWACLHRGVVIVAVPLADSAVPSVDEELRMGCGKPRGRGQSPRPGFRGSRRRAVRPRGS